jgi:hypothetical protein
LVSDEIIVSVLEGKELPTNSERILSSQGVQKQEVVASSNSFRYVQTKTKFAASMEEDFFQSKRYYLFLILPLFLIPVVMFVGKKQKQRANDLMGNRIRKADKLARKYLSQAKKELGKKEAFYIALEKALHNYLKAKLQVETSDISKDKIVKILGEKGVVPGVVSDFIQVLDDCDFARYAPVTDVMMNEEFDKAKEVIAKLDKQL